MADTTFVDFQEPTINAGWLNDINIAVYRALGLAGIAPTTAAEVISNLNIQSSSIGFTQAGTGAVLRTVQSRLRDMIDIKDFGATGDGATDDSVNIIKAADAARAAGKGLYVSGGTYKVSQSIPLGGLTVVGQSELGSVFQATNAQFDVITTVGESYFVSFGINGGWDGVTSGLSGDSLSIKNGSNTPYNVHCSNLRIQSSKKRAIFALAGAYSSIYDCKINAAGLDGIALEGVNAGTLVTTFMIGSTTSSDCPNGYGLSIYEGAAITAIGMIIENTQGIIVNGGDNRAITLIGIWQEGTTTAWAVTLPAGTSGGQGLTVQGNFGLPISNNPLWVNVTMPGNSANQVNSMAANGRKVFSISLELVQAAPADFTLTSVVLSPGEWQMCICAQTINAAGATVGRVGIQATTDVTASGLNIATNGAFTPAAAEATSFGTDKDARLSASFGYTNATTGDITLYLRCYTDTSAGQLAVKGSIYGTKLI